MGRQHYLTKGLLVLCYVSSENAGSQEKMPLPKCRWRHFVLPAFSLAFVPDLSKAVNRIFSSYLCQAFNSDILNHMLKRRTVSQSVSINNVPSLLPEFRLKIKVT